MAVYNFRSWETINLEPVSNDTTYRILDHPASGSPAEETTGVIYDGFILAQYNLQNLNEILSMYSNPYNITFSSGLQENFAAVTNFYIYYTTDGWQTYTNDQIILTYDWSYSDNDRVVLSDPISNIIDARQYLLYSVRPITTPMDLVVNVGQVEVDRYTLTEQNNYNYVKYIQDIDRFPGEFNLDYSYDYLVNASSIKPGTFYNMTIGGNNFIVTNTCYRYCIYYFNKYGGWDSLLFEGKTIQNDNLSRLSYSKNYVAGSTNFNKVNYVTTVKETWDLNTSFLDDLHSEKIINIMGSNLLYLHDLEENKIIPVNITNSQCTHKTYINQGRKIYNYTISVEASQPKYRM